MVSDEQVRLIALFFLFSSMDESVAIPSAQKAIAQLKSISLTAGSGATSAGGAVNNAQLVSVVRKIWDQHLKTPGRKRPISIPETPWRLPDHLELAPWVKFQKDSSPEQVVAVVLSKILGFKDNEIAEGLNISIGTARYRVSKGIRQLGGVMKATGY